MQNVILYLHHVSLITMNPTEVSLRPLLIIVKGKIRLLCATFAHCLVTLSLKIGVRVLVFDVDNITDVKCKCVLYVLIHTRSLSFLPIMYGAEVSMGDVPVSTRAERHSVCET